MPRKTDDGGGGAAAGRVRFNEAAARCRGKHGVHLRIAQEIASLQ